MPNYYYDAFGRRIAKSSDVKRKSRLTSNEDVLPFKKAFQHEKTEKSTTLMLWDGNRQIQEYVDDVTFTTVYEQDSFVPVARLVWNNGSDDEQNSELKVYYYHTDHLGTPNELTDSEGNVIWLADYNAWGSISEICKDFKYQQQTINDIVIDEVDLQPIRFQGQFFDVESGLHYNRFRYYDNDLGMFVSRDPIGLNGGNNVFAYAPNPVSWVDPLGLNNDLMNDLDPMIQAEKAFYAGIEAFKNSAPIRFIDSIGKKATEGGNGEVESGGRVACLVGIDQKAGVAIDTKGKACVTATTCVLVGPYCGASVNGAVNASTGKLTPNSSGYSFGTTAGAKLGIGGSISGAVGTDGSVTGSYGNGFGVEGGVALTFCKKHISKTCK